MNCTVCSGVLDELVPVESAVTGLHKYRSRVCVEGSAHRLRCWRRVARARTREGFDVTLEFDLLAQVRRGPVEQIRANPDRDYGRNFVDEGCDYAPKCLRCPFPVCVEDDPYLPEFRAGKRSSRTQQRTRSIERAIRAATHGSQVTIAKKFGVSTRTVYRIKKGMK